MNLDREGVPITAQDALELWDSGSPVPAIRVEAEAHSQDQIYSAAFELIRLGHPPVGSVWVTGLTSREADVAISIFEVTTKNGWRAMLAQHDHPSIAKLTVKKPPEEQEKQK